jgi:AcrR family transcriptional regulator
MKRTPAVGEAAPWRGRPRSARTEQAIIEATLGLLSEVGYGGLSIEGVAARAGVAKTTIYRRWRTKAELAVAAAEELAQKVRVPDTGSTLEDLVLLLRDIIKVYRTTVAGRILPGLIAEWADNPELAAVFRRFFGSRREIMLQVLKSGVSQGELRPDLDPELTADLLYGPIYYRLLVSGAPLTAALANRIVDAVIRGKGVG